jgi:hypothetical protein
MTRIHYNFHKKNFTLSEYIKGRGWIKSGEADTLYIRKPVFKVSKAGNERARRQGVKNVHAFVYGEVVPFAEALDMAEGYVSGKYSVQSVMYNYKKYDQFVDCTSEEPVTEGEWAIGRMLFDRPNLLVLQKRD